MFLEIYLKMPKVACVFWKSYLESKLILIEFFELRHTRPTSYLRSSVRRRADGDYTICIAEICKSHALLGQAFCTIITTKKYLIHS